MKGGPRRINSRTKAPSLSLCMIVKDEEETLERCLSTARPHVDEIVIVDTGSTDGTLDIARRYADVLDEIAWPGSFSEARNESIARSSGDYNLILDADEYIDAPEHWAKIRQVLRSSAPAAVEVVVNNVLGERALTASHRDWQVRVFPNDALLRYAGSVHNQIYQGVQAFVQRTGRPVVRVPAEIIHTGYAQSPEEKREKFRKRLPLLRREYEEAGSAGDRAYYGFQLARVLGVLKDVAGAAEVLSAIDYDALNDTNAFSAHHLAARVFQAAQQPAQALRHANAMLGLTRDEPLAYFECGRSLLQANRTTDGLLMLLEAFNVQERVEGASYPLNPRELVGTLRAVCEREGLRRHADVFGQLHEQPELNLEMTRALILSLQTELALVDQGAAG